MKWKEDDNLITVNLNYNSHNDNNDAKTHNDYNNSNTNSHVYDKMVGITPIAPQVSVLDPALQF